VSVDPGLVKDFGSCAAGPLGALKRGLANWALSLPRRRPEEIPDLVTGPAAYLFFSHGNPLRIGSSGRVEYRVTGQIGTLKRSVAWGIARSNGMPTTTACPHCGVGSGGDSPEFKELIDSLDLDLEVVVFPDRLLAQAKMEREQFEGLLIWALTPPLNTLKEIGKLYRRDKTGHMAYDACGSGHIYQRKDESSENPPAEAPPP
jgi:hypothetical protein